GEDLIRSRQEGDPKEEDQQDAGHPGYGPLGVVGLRFAERRDAIGDRLDPRQGGTPGREGPEDEKGGHGRHRNHGGRGERHHRGLPPEETGEAQDDEAEHADHEEVGRGGEQPSRLPRAAQIRYGDRRHRHDAEEDALPVEGGPGGGDGGHARGHADGNGQDIIDEQGGAGYQARGDAPVILADEIRTAARRS